ncbi:MAG: class I SAM-dependent methyltransferase [Pirellulales bacterium]
MLEPVNSTHVVECFDELPLWSAPFGLMILEHLKLAEHWTYLDLGCGTGFLAIEIAERTGSHSKVIAVDIWQEALTRLQRKLTLRNVFNVQVIECDAVNLLVPDKSVDVVVCNLGINNFPDPFKVVLECNRVLKNHGQLLITTNLSGHMDEFYQVFRSTLDELGLQQHVDSLTCHIAHRGTKEQTETLLNSAGFDVDFVEQRSLEMNFANGTALLSHYFMRLAFIPAWKELVPELMHQPFFSQLERKLNQHAIDEGGLTLTIPMLFVSASKQDDIQR